MKDWSTRMSVLQTFCFSFFLFARVQAVPPSQRWRVSFSIHLFDIGMNRIYSLIFWRTTMRIVRKLHPNKIEGVRTKVDTVQGLRPVKDARHVHAHALRLVYWPRHRSKYAPDVAWWPDLAALSLQSCFLLLRFLLWHWPSQLWNVTTRRALFSFFVHFSNSARGRALIGCQAKARCANTTALN